MNRPEVYHKSVQILYDAYFNDTLEHKYCNKCAVGNICKEAAYLLGLASACWSALFMTKHGVQLIAKGSSPVNNHYDIDDAKRLIAATDYSQKELMKIELSFESAPKGENKEEYMFNGLVAVLEVLKQIHEVTDEDLIQANHNRFKEHHERKSQTVCMQY